MIKNLIMLLIVVVIGWIAYATFFGNDQDKNLRDNLLDNVISLGKSVGNVFSHESDKFQKGAYDDALKKMGEAINNLRQTSEEVEDADKYASQLKEIEAKKAELEKMAASLENQENGNGMSRPAGTADKRKVDELGQEILKELEELGKEIKKAKSKES